MSTPEDRIKEENQKKEQDIKRLIELHGLQVNKMTKEEKAEYKHLLAMYEKEILTAPSAFRPQTEHLIYFKEPPLNKTNLTTSDLIKDDLKPMLEDYKRKTGKEPDKTDKGVAFTFKTQNDAVSFFKEQATKGHSFTVYCATRDHCIFSDGNGSIVQGTKAEIDAYRKNPENYKVDEKGALTSKNTPEETDTQQKGLKI
ncbi:hypothetical protein [Legionella fairfieldensis]|uniref:hypothetical protein n=1 Tax=Legionella fairfieldensis TaxID=45064 RepID=UPI0006884D7F|nr:hypothetical protein [Legionella fairfieldensis]